MGRILLTGGAWFLGSHVADALLARGHDVTVLDDLSGDDKANVARAERFVQGSVTGADDVRRVFAEPDGTFVGRDVAKLPRAMGAAVGPGARGCAARAPRAR